MHPTDVFHVNLSASDWADVVNPMPQRFPKITILKGGIFKPSPNGSCSAGIWLPAACFLAVSTGIIHLVVS